MLPQLVAEGTSAYAKGVSPSDYVQTILRHGRRVLRNAGISSQSDDAAMLAYLCLRRMSALSQEFGSVEDDWIAAGEVLDLHVSDEDAVLLCELLPLTPEAPVGAMTPEVTAVHSFLLTITGSLRERWVEE